MGAGGSSAALPTRPGQVVRDAPSYTDIAEQFGAFAAGTGTLRGGRAVAPQIIGGPPCQARQDTSRDTGFDEQCGKGPGTESLYREELESCRTALGETHPDMLSSMNNLGRLLQEQGCYEEAEQLLRNAAQVILEGRRTKLGEMHPETLTSMHSLGSLLQERGHLEEERGSEG
ncbi:klc-2 [Symbiodinium sp. CCMP2456]|nr:klc-2 [Symbiodinium sp. CCMP2456]